jgi:hypothetical protein
MSDPERPGNQRELDDDEPAASPADGSADEALPGIDGNFYRGLIVFLDRVRGRGTIRSYSGREIHFQFPFVQVVGAPIGGRAPGLDRLKQGDTVGFDVGWTSHGLRVTLINPAS